MHPRRCHSITDSLEPSLCLQITDFLARRIVPDLKRFLIDADKTAGVCSNMVYYIVAPAFKTRNRYVQVSVHLEEPL